MENNDLSKFKEYISEEEYERLLKTKKTYPFLSFFVFVDSFYYGIIQKSNKDYISIYLLNFIKERKDKEIFIKLSQDWWWETNRNFPINFFHRNWDIMFKKYLRTFNWSGIKCYTGPVLNIDTCKSKVKLIEI